MFHELDLLYDRAGHFISNLGNATQRLQRFLKMNLTQCKLRNRIFVTTNAQRKFRKPILFIINRNAMCATCCVNRQKRNAICAKVFKFCLICKATFFELDKSVTQLSPTYCLLLLMHWPAHIWVSYIQPFSRVCKLPTPQCN